LKLHADLDTISETMFVTFMHTSQTCSEFYISLQVIYVLTKIEKDANGCKFLDKRPKGA